MVSRIGAVALVLAAMTAGMSVSRAAPPAPGSKAAPAPAPAGRPAGPPTQADGRADNNIAPATPQVSQDAAARARMHECAHQWSTIKKAGNAGATTWKEFSSTCLVVSK